LTTTQKTIFEVFDSGSSNSRSLFGGGRYDDLVGIFGVEKVTAFGFGMGDVTIKDYLETYNLIPNNLNAAPDLYICTTNDEYLKDATNTASSLRKQNIKVAVDLSGRKISAQIKTADKQLIPFIICLGENEIKSEKYNLKDMRSGKESLMTLDQIAQKLKRK
jgi:histidyl-tRNA synthetase